MAKRSQEEKNFLSMAGEFLVAAELNRRKILSAVTYGAAKSADVWAFDESSKRAVRVEVKTTGQESKKWVIGEKALVKENWDKDDFWVLVLLPSPQPNTATTSNEIRGQHTPRYFVFSSEELGRLLSTGDERNRTAYITRHNTEFTGKVVPNFPVSEALEIENRWDKIENRVRKTVTA